MTLAPSPFPVAVRTAVFTDPDRLDVLRLASEDDPRSDRTLTVEVWYPAVAGSGSPAVYEDSLRYSLQPSFTFAGRAFRDAEPLRAGAPWPLVVVSHGYPGSRVLMTWLCEDLASRGFVVVAPDFPRSTHADQGPRAATLLDRPLDILFVVRALAAADGWLAGLVDADRTGLVGYSMGGYGSLNAAGAGFRSSYVTWPDSVPKGRLAIRQTGDEALAASLDPRIRCVAAIAPWGATAAWGPADLLALRMPLLYVVGDRDDVAGVDPGVVDLFRWSVRARRHLLLLRGAGHAIGANAVPPEATDPRDRAHYDEPGWDRERLQELLRDVIGRFLELHLRAVGPGLRPTSGPDFELSEAGPLPEPAPRPCLPTRDADPVGRAAGLARERETYRFNHTINPPLAMADALAPSDQFPPEWLAANLRVLGELARNGARARQAFEPSRVPDPALLALADRAISGDYDDPWPLLHELQVALESDRPSGTASSLVDFAALFQTIEKPVIAATWLDADVFAANFVAGADPLVLAAVDIVTDERVRRALSAGVPDVEATGAVLVADYAILAGVETGQYGARKKYLPAPCAFFAVRDGRLKAVAIRIGPAPGDEVVTPDDGAAWRVAMTGVRVADANLSALWFHHARTHMVIEPCVLAARRQLSERHPVRVLLEPHFAGTLAINRAGQVTVFAEGGAIETVGAATRPAFRALAVKAVQTQAFRDLEPRGAFARRGLLDPAGLRDYPFRDDTIRLWDAIGEWVAAYLALYYDDHAAVRDDEELAAFVAELGASDGGRLRGVGTVATLADLTEVVAIVIHTASVVHWALNGPLRTDMTFVPNYPLAAYGPLRTNVTDDDLLAMMPPLDQAQRQFEAAYGMGSTRFGRLGEYPSFADPRVDALVASFQDRLRRIEADIRERNRGSAVPYEMLLPSQIPASINI